jgi:hypothetical protein
VSAYLIRYVIVTSSLTFTDFSDLMPLLGPTHVNLAHNFPQSPTRIPSTTFICDVHAQVLAHDACAHSLNHHVHAHAGRLASTLIPIRILCCHPSTSDPHPRPKCETEGFLVVNRHPLPNTSQVCVYDF